MHLNSKACFIFILLRLLSVSYVTALPVKPGSQLNSKPSPLIAHGERFPILQLTAVVKYDKTPYQWKGRIPSLVDSNPLLSDIHTLIEAEIRADKAVQALHAEEVVVMFLSRGRPPRFDNNTHDFGFHVRYYDGRHPEAVPSCENGKLTFLPRQKLDDEVNSVVMKERSLDFTWRYMQHFYPMLQPSTSAKKPLNPAAHAFDPAKKPESPYDLKVEWR
ncbi:hypothetical protein C8J55DRAFT_561237 [Lentinula edodes]|uniref:Nudix hydrolase domain-containing protein n=1 Tax=Lentinula lateritia TaxID=40482 RepID=A0A9W9A9F8_9AGAR|nr:hypothetical protein C8J55DRAFT_561237 [Lentinula edodes]